MLLQNRRHHGYSAPLKSPDSDPGSVPHELEHEGYVGMPGRTRGETRVLRNASREYVHRHSLSIMYHLALVAIRGTIDEAARSHGASKAILDQPNAPASDVTKPHTSSDVDKLLHETIWRYSMNHEFVDLLQAGTFAPTPA